MNLLDCLLNVFEMFSPSWRRERWLLLLSLLLFILVVFRLDWLALFVERLRLRVLADGVI